MSQDQIRVAVVGAGIAGLTLGVALNAFDKDSKVIVDLYESAPELSEIGAGINIWPRTWQVLKHIGLSDALLPFLDHYPDLRPRVAFEIRKADQQNGFKVMDIIKNGGALRMHRADLQRGLLTRLPVDGSSPYTLNLSHRLVDYIESPTGVILYFANGRSATCDILVGADGIKSTVRHHFLTRLPNPGRYEKCLDPVWSGTVVYRGLVSKEALKKEFPGHRALNHPGVMYVGKNKHVVVYPVSGGKFINVVAGNHDRSKDGTIWEGPLTSEVPQEELLARFRGWEDELQALLNCIKRPTKWSLQRLNLADTFARGRVLLIGDAAHAMLPHQGAGAGVGIEDAYILATLLTTCRTSPCADIPQILETYNTIRVPRATSMSDRSRKQGCLLNLDAPGLESFREGDYVPKEMLVRLFRTVQTNWNWIAGDPEEDRREAIRAML